MRLLGRGRVVGIVVAALGLGLGAVTATDATLAGSSSNGSNSFTADTAFDTYGEAVLADGPLFYHRMSDAAGTVMDDASANNRDGVYNQAAAATYYSRVPGRILANSAAQFSGSNAYVVAESAVSGAAPDTFSVEFWFKSTSTDGGKLVGYGNGRLGLSTSYDRDVYLDSTGKVTFRVLDGANGNKYVTSSAVLRDGNWHHIVATLGGGFARLYVDGSLVPGTGQGLGSVAASVGEVNPNGFWRVGGDQLGFGGLPNTPASDYVNATVDEVAIYSTALTATQVTEHVTAAADTTGSASTVYRTEVLTESPYLYWRFDEAGSQRASDSSGNSRHGFYHLGPDVWISPPTTNVADQWTGDTGDSATLFNGVDAFVTTESTTAVAGLDTFSAEVWFKTTSISGGKLIGFGSSRTGTTGSVDRHIYLDKDNKVTFGVFNGGVTKVIRSASALNDGNWHHVVGTLNGGTGVMKLYVDNVAQSGGTQTGVTGGEAYSGFWRVGGGKLDGGWPDTPSSQFAGATIDEAAVYSTALSATQVTAHWNERAGVDTSANYRAAVLTDSPYLYWRLGEASQQQAVDASPNGRSGTYLPAGGAFSGTDARNGSARFNGVCLVNSTSCATSSGGTTVGIAAYNPYAQSGPDTFTLELWFKTRTTVGGELIGFGSRQTGLSDDYDRMIYMRNDGYLLFGAHPGGVQTIVGTTALNDNQWHHVAASLGTGGMRLYVDGVLQASNTGVTSSASYSGYWRIGGDRLQGWTNAPSSFYFAGHIDEVAVFGSQLTTERIQAHYHSRDR